MLVYLLDCFTPESDTYVVGVYSTVELALNQLKIEQNKKDNEGCLFSVIQCELDNFNNREVVCEEWVDG